MPNLKQSSSTKSKNRNKSLRQNEPATARRRQPIFEIQASETDDKSIKAFIEECFVPILAERFFAEQEKTK
jgi:hypothetical protein